MFDITLRPLKDRIFDPLCTAIPSSITPGNLTFLAFHLGLLSCTAAEFGFYTWSLILWTLNRVLDCLDGALARHRNQASDLGGFFDLLSDFVVYSLIPISCASGSGRGEVGLDLYHTKRLWAAVAYVEASFHVNNFILFYIAAVTEKRKAAAALSKGSTVDGNAGKAEARKVEELTSVSMRPALIEGAESGAILTLMLALPSWTEWLCWLLFAGVMVGIVQRMVWVVDALQEK